MGLTRLTFSPLPLPLEREIELEIDGVLETCTSIRRIYDRLSFGTSYRALVKKSIFNMEKMNHETK